MTLGTSSPRDKSLCWQRGGVLAIVAVLLVSTGCGSQKRKQGVAELERLQSAVREMDIVVSAGTNQFEFSRRLTDSLLKIGDLQQSQNQTVNDFPKRDQPTVTEVYQHLALALEAYKQSKDFFGDTHKQQLDPFEGDNLLGEQRYEALQKQFPNLDKLELAIDYSDVAGGAFGGKEYWKGDMLQALWKVAEEESEAAKKLIDKLSQE